MGRGFVNDHNIILIQNGNEKPIYMVLMKAPIQRYQKQQAFEKNQKKLVMTKKSLNFKY